MTRKVLKVVEISFYQLHTQILVELCNGYYSVALGGRIVEIYRLGTRPEQIVGADSFLIPSQPKEAEVLLIGMLNSLSHEELDLIRASCYLLNKKSQLSSQQGKSTAVNLLQSFLDIEKYEVTSDN